MWLVVGTVSILPMYSTLIKDTVGAEVSDALDTVGEELGESGLAGSETPIPVSIRI